MTSFTSFHVIHLNPEEMTKAKFRFYTRFHSSADEETADISDVCGDMFNISFRVEYKNDKYRLYANVSGKKDNQTCGHSFKFSSDFDTDTEPILNTKAGWQLIGCKKRFSHSSNYSCYNMSLELIKEEKAPFKDLYTDVDLTDFELRGQGPQEAVRVHRSVLAVSSPVLKSMVQRNWNEGKQGHVTVPEVTKATLEHFKKYLYLKELPDSTMDCVKLLPMIYLMPELGINCTIKIVDVFKPEDGWEWLEHFVSNAVGHKAYFLLAALFKNMKKDNIKALEEIFSKLSISTE